MEETEKHDAEYDKRFLHSAPSTIIFPDHNGTIYALSHDKTFFVYAYSYFNSKTNEQWYNIEMGNPISQKLFHQLISLPICYGMAESIEITQDNNLIVIAMTQWISKNQNTQPESMVKVWNSRNGDFLHAFYKYASSGKLSIGSVATSDDSSLLAIGYNDLIQSPHDEGSIDIYDLKTGRNLHSIATIDLNSTDLLTSLVITSNNQYLVACYKNGLRKTLELKEMNLPSPSEHSDNDCIIS